jgi:DNA replication protein DnaC
LRLTKLVPSPANVRETKTGIEGLAASLLDRLVHNAYRIELRGDSMRRRQPDPPGDVKN